MEALTRSEGPRPSRGSARASRSPLPNGEPPVGSPTPPPAVAPHAATAASMAAAVASLRNAWELPALWRLLWLLRGVLGLPAAAVAELEADFAAAAAPTTELLAALHGRLLGAAAGPSCAGRWLLLLGRFVRKRPAVFALLLAGVARMEGGGGGTRRPASAATPTAAATPTTRATSADAATPVSPATTAATGGRPSASPPPDRGASAVLLDEVFGEEAWEDLRNGRPSCDRGGGVGDGGGDGDGVGDGNGDDDGDGNGDDDGGARPVGASAARGDSNTVAGGYLADMVYPSPPQLSDVRGATPLSVRAAPRSSPGGGGGGGVGVGDAPGGVPPEELLPMHVFDNEATYMAAVPPVTRLRILHAVGEAVWAEHDTTASHLPPGTVATLHASDLAVSPLGSDAAGNLWWYFGDGDRVYREPDVVAAAATARRAAVRAAAAAAAEREAAARKAAEAEAAAAEAAAKAAAAARKAARKGKGRRKAPEIVRPVASRSGRILKPSQRLLSSEPAEQHEQDHRRRRNRAATVSAKTTGCNGARDDKASVPRGAPAVAAASAADGPGRAADAPAVAAADVTGPAVALAGAPKADKEGRLPSSGRSVDAIAATTTAQAAAGATRPPVGHRRSLPMDVDAGSGASPASSPATDLCGNAKDAVDATASDVDNGSDVDIGSDGEPVSATVTRALRLVAAPTACTHWEVVVEGPEALDAVIAALRSRAHPREVALAEALSDVPAADFAAAAAALAKERARAERRDAEAARAAAREVVSRRPSARVRALDAAREAAAAEAAAAAQQAADLEAAAAAHAVVVEAAVEKLEVAMTDGWRGLGLTNLRLKPLPPPAPPPSLPSAVATTATDTAGEGRATRRSGRLSRSCASAADAEAINGAGGGIDAAGDGNRSHSSRRRTEADVPPPRRPRPERSSRRLMAGISYNDDEEEEDGVMAPETLTVRGGRTRRVAVASSAEDEADVGSGRPGEGGVPNGDAMVETRDDEAAGAAADIPNGGGAEGDASPAGGRGNVDAGSKADPDPGRSIDGEGHTRVAGGGALDVAATPPGVIHENDLDGAVFNWDMEGGTPHRVMDRYALILIDAHASPVKVEGEEVGKGGKKAVGKGTDAVESRKQAVGGGQEPVGDGKEAVGDSKEAVGNRRDAVEDRKQAAENGKEAVDDGKEAAGDGKGNDANRGTRGGDPTGDVVLDSAVDRVGGSCGEAAGVSAGTVDGASGSPRAQTGDSEVAPSAFAPGFIGLDMFPPKAHPASNGRALHGRGVVVEKTVVQVDPTPTGPLAIVLEGIGLPASTIDGLPVRLRTGRVVDWAIDYGPVPAIWVRTVASWYRLTDIPAAAYAATSRLSRLRLALATRAYALAHPVSAARAAADVTADRVIQSLVTRRRGGWAADELAAEAPWFLNAADGLSSSVLRNAAIYREWKAAARTAARTAARSASRAAARAAAAAAAEAASSAPSPAGTPASTLRKGGHPTGLLVWRGWHRQWADRADAQEAAHVVQGGQGGGGGRTPASAPASASKTSPPRVAAVASAVAAAPTLPPPPPPAASVTDPATAPVLQPQATQAEKAALLLGTLAGPAPPPQLSSRPSVGDGLQPTRPAVAASSQSTGGGLDRPAAAPPVAPAMPAPTASLASPMSASGRPSPAVLPASVAPRTSAAPPAPAVLPSTAAPPLAAVPPSAVAPPSAAVPPTLTAPPALPTLGVPLAPPASTAPPTSVAPLTPVVPSSSAIRPTSSAPLAPPSLAAKEAAPRRAVGPETAPPPAVAATSSAASVAAGAAAAAAAAAAGASAAATTALPPQPPPPPPPPPPPVPPAGTAAAPATPGTAGV
ncbi:hypothetical protein MMPV_000381 [Pyropia vietnamensis]